MNDTTRTVQETAHVAAWVPRRPVLRGASAAGLGLRGLVGGRACGSRFDDHPQEGKAYVR